MRRIIIILLTLFVNAAAFSQIDSLEYGSFGKIKIYHPAKQPASLVLFVSGDGGWNKGVSEMAKNMASNGVMVAGVDIVNYFKALKKEKLACYYPAADFEDLSLTIQKFPKYIKPLLAGYSSGATLAYGMLVQAPAGTFKGAVALGFCPDFATNRPLCKGNGLISHVLKPGKSFYLERTLQLSAPFVVLNGTIDKVCPATGVASFMKNMPNAKLISLPKVGHGFSVTSRWLPQLLQTLHFLVDAPGLSEVLKIPPRKTVTIVPTVLPAGLPLTLLPVTKPNNQPLAILLSGDGGWTSFDQAIAVKLVKKGVAVLGLDTQQYFWRAQTPEKTSLEISKILNHYMQLWDKKNVVLIGYSFGASVVPFIADRFSPDLKEKLRGIVMLSPEEKADFEIHITDMLDLGNSSDHYDVLAELRAIRALNPVCFFGSSEGKSIPDQFKKTGIKVVILPGSHHYDNNYDLITEQIFKNITK
jgi:type IV secretory pathway VirJ component